MMIYQRSFEKLCQNQITNLRDMDDK